MTQNVEAVFTEGGELGRELDHAQMLVSQKMCAEESRQCGGPEGCDACDGKGDPCHMEAFAKVAISALQSLGWVPPTEREAIRAAALMEVAKWHENEMLEIKRLLKTGNANPHGETQMSMEWIFHRTSSEKIQSLSTMPSGYVAVKQDDGPVDSQSTAR